MSPEYSSSVGKATAEEVALFNRVRQKAPGAYEDYVRRYAPRLLHFAQRSLKPAQAEEVVMLAMAWAVKDFDPQRQRLKAHLFNVCREAVRERVRQLKQEGADADYVADSTFGRLIPSRNGEVGPAQMDGWSELTPVERAVVGLRYYGCLRNLEIAEALGCDPGAICQIAKRARQKLRRGQAHE